MPAYPNILYLIGALLLAGGGVAFASDDNPWSMDETVEGPKSVEGRKSIGDKGRGRVSIVRKQQFKPLLNGQSLNKGHQITKGSRSNSLSFGKGVSGFSGKEGRDQFYGYSGSQPKTHSREIDRSNKGHFGSFPPLNGKVGNRKKTGISGQIDNGVQFRGKSFGSFPPIERKAGERQRQKLQKIRREHQRLLRQQSSGFTNVLPPPIPDPVPEQAYPYPYSGYSAYPGTGRQGMGYGSSMIGPGMPDLTRPGFVW